MSKDIGAPIVNNKTAARKQWVAKTVSLKTDESSEGKGNKHSQPAESDPCFGYAHDNAKKGKRKLPNAYNNEYSKTNGKPDPRVPAFIPSDQGMPLREEKKSAHEPEEEYKQKSKGNSSHNSGDSTGDASSIKSNSSEGKGIKHSQPADSELKDSPKGAEGKGNKHSQPAESAPKGDAKKFEGKGNRHSQPADSNSNASVPDKPSRRSKVRKNQEEQLNAPQEEVKQQSQPNFHGWNAVKLSESYDFGSEGIAILQSKFSHLLKQGASKFNLTGTAHHDHSYGAFCRKYMDRAITEGCCANDEIIDVGGHLIRTCTSSRTVKGKTEPWSKTIHSMCPIVDANDMVRHKNWSNQLRARSIVAENMCPTKAALGGLCHCTKPDGTEWSDGSIKSIDSAYYPGVLQGIEATLVQHPERTAYLAFNDYHSAIAKGKTHYFTPDNEAEVNITRGPNGFLVSSKVRGNPYPYEHAVIATSRNDSWYRSGTVAQGGIFFYERCFSFPMGEHEYIGVQVTFLPQTLRFPGLERIPEYYVTPVPINDAQHTDALIEIGMGKVKDMDARFGCSIVLKNVWAWLRADADSRGAIINKIQTGVYDVTLTYKLVSGGFKTDKMRVKEEIFHKAICKANSFVGKSAHMILQALYLEFSKTEPVDLIQGSLKFAAYVNGVTLLDINAFIYGSSEIQGAADSTKGRFQDVSWFISFISDPLKSVVSRTRFELFRFLSRPIIFIPLLIYLYSALIGAVRADDGSEEKFTLRWYYVLLTLIAICFFKSVYLETRLRLGRRWIKGSCVRDKSRLDMELYKGRFDPQWKFRDPTYNISGMKGDEAADFLGCEAGDERVAGQIGPIFQGQEYYEPTVIHSCKQTKMAAALRACMNRIHPDPTMFGKWSGWFSKIEGEFISYIKSEGGLVVNLDEWLLKYPEAYRDQVYRALDRADLFEKKYTYDSFPKRELQFTTVPKALKETPENTVKERQISGPSVDKKIAANAFIHALEGVAHRHMKEYCGRANWEEICEGLDSKRFAMRDPIFGFADGSGFDMTQVQMIQIRFNKFIDRILAECNITFDPRIGPNEVRRAFAESTTLTVNVDRGAVTYKAEGRASGDGWTTFGNTILMISYWRFIFDQLNIPKDQQLLKVKGDDVVFAVERPLKELLETGLPRFMATENKVVREHGLGQITKFVHWGNLDDGDFLSNMFFIRSDGTSRMVRIPARVFQTTAWSLKVDPKTKNIDQVAKELLYSKGQCMLAWAKGIPIFEVLGKKLVSLGINGPHTSYDMYADEARVWKGDTEGDWLSCALWMGHRFGVTIEQIRELELQIAAIRNPLEVISNPIIDLFYA